MKWSKFNFFYQSKNKNEWILYNTVSNLLITIDHANYEKLIELKNNPDLLNQFSNSDEFITSKILVKDDQIEIDKLKLEVLQKRFSRNILDLTIVPTLSCNFKCTYCFQKERPEYIINEATENNIINFIKKFKDNVKLIRITWFGGEPLLAFDKMSSICQKIIKEINIPFESHIISNGYLLNKNIITQLNILHTNFIQITIDGLEEEHNKRRLFNNNEGTFQTIINNLEFLIKQNSEIKIAIRINIDAANKNEYNKIYMFLSKHFENDKIIIYPGFVDNYSYICSSIESCSLKRNERANFLIEQYTNYGLYSDKFYPTVDTNSCMSRYINSYVIGPFGELYKCLAVVGIKEMEIGNINNTKRIIENDNLLTEFLKGSDYLDRNECNNCMFFPVCDGGCPYLKIKEKHLGIQYDCCSIIKENLDKFLNIHIEMKQSK